jgi:hypothetical protein
MLHLLHNMPLTQFPQVNIPEQHEWSWSITSFSKEPQASQPLDNISAYLSGDIPYRLRLSLTAFARLFLFQLSRLYSLVQSLHL